MARLMQKSRQRMLKYCRMGILLTLVVVVVTPVRNVVLSPFLPTMWLPHNSFRVVQMLMDNQHFPVDSPFVQPTPGPEPLIVFNLSDVNKFLSKEDPYKDFFLHKHALQTLAHTDPKVAEDLAMLEAFQPILSLEERAQLLFTMHAFQTVCERHHIQFFICEGTLLGYYRHGGLIPWDDDIDVCVYASDWQKIHHVLGNVPGFSLFAPRDSQWKFYLSDLPVLSDKAFKFPFIDIFFMREYGPYTWSITWGVKNHLILKTKHLLPLTTVQWEMFRLPSPVCQWQLMEKSYSVNCETTTYMHKSTIQHHYGFQTVDCRRLHRYLPFVFRETGKGGRVVENRKVGGRVLQNWTVAPPPDFCLED